MDRATDLRCREEGGRPFDREVNELGYRAVLAKWHAFDKFYHFFMHKIDPAAAGFEPDAFDRYETLHRTVLAIASDTMKPSAPSLITAEGCARKKSCPILQNRMSSARASRAAWGEWKPNWRISETARRT